MRNILVTVMMLIVVVILFNTIIDDNSTGTKKYINDKGTQVNAKINALVTP